MRRKCSSRKKKLVSSIETLPDDVLINQILRRVASSSFTDIANAKLSCKRLKEITEDRCIYQHASLDNIPMVEWSPLTKQHKIFLNKCSESGNPEILYRQAVLEYFTKENPDMETTIANLDRAAKVGHTGAVYVTCIINLLSGNKDFKREAIKLIGSMNKSVWLKRMLGSRRSKLMNELNELWGNNPVLKNRPTCCTAQHQRLYTNSWELVDYECEECDADAEIDCIYASITR